MKTKEIISKARNCKKNVEKLQKIGVSDDSAYYFAKVILGAKTEVKELKIKAPKTPSGDYISRQIKKADYVDMAKRLVAYVEKNKQMPNYITYSKFKIEHKLYTYLFADALVTSVDTAYLPKEVNISSKLFVTKVETAQQVYDYFIKVFGNFGDTIDGALAKINGRGYGYYYDDKLSNKETIDGLAHKTNARPNCTDVCQMLVNLLKVLIKKGKYKRVDVIHVKCSGGDGHVRLKITLKDGSVIYRDGACTISDNGKGATCNWCIINFTLLAVNPSWFMTNLNR